MALASWAGDDAGLEADEEPAAGVPEALLVTVPTFRQDLVREIDLVEEVARIHGVDRLRPTMPARRGRGGLTPEQRRIRQVEDLLQSAGLSEVITYAFTDPAWLPLLRLPADDERLRPVPLANPLSSDQSVMRTMLLPGLLAAAAHNRALREDRVHLFESGKTFHSRLPLSEMARAEGREAAAVLPAEVRRVGFLLAGRVDRGIVEPHRRPHRLLPGQGPGGAGAGGAPGPGLLRPGDGALPPSGEERRGGLPGRSARAGWARCTRWSSRPSTCPPARWRPSSIWTSWWPRPVPSPCSRTC